MQRQQRKAAKAASCPEGVKTAEVDSLPKKRSATILGLTSVPVTETAPPRREVNMEMRGSLSCPARPRPSEPPEL